MSGTSQNTSSDLNKALKAFEATEANIDKLERLWGQLKERIPQGIDFSTDPQYDNLLRHFCLIADSLPTIDGWKLEERPLDLDSIAQNRLDAKEVGEIESEIWVEQKIYLLDFQLGEYRFKFDQKRRKALRVILEKKIHEVDALLLALEKLLDENERGNEVNDDKFERLCQIIQEINTLLGSSIPRPPRWTDLIRHLHFGMMGDLSDIIKWDWPAIREPLINSLIGENDPIPSEVQDLNEIIIPAAATMSIITELNWDALDDERFERLIFNLISAESGYENPQWLTHSNAPDRGRDLSVERVIVDKLAGTMRQRVIIQCKHWLKKSIAIGDIASLREQLALWEPPRVDVCIIATSGRFTTDAVAAIEKNNQSDRALKIEPWPNSHLERLVAARPGLIAEFGLR